MSPELRCHWGKMFSLQWCSHGWSQVKSLKKNLTIKKHLNPFVSKVEKNLTVIVNKPDYLTICQWSEFNPHKVVLCLIMPIFSKTTFQKDFSIVFVFLNMYNWIKFLFTIVIWKFLWTNYNLENVRNCEPFDWMFFVFHLQTAFYFLQIKRKNY